MKRLDIKAAFTINSLKNHQNVSKIFFCTGTFSCGCIIIYKTNKFSCLSPSVFADHHDIHTTKEKPATELVDSIVSDIIDIADVMFSIIFVAMVWRVYKF